MWCWRWRALASRRHDGDAATAARTIVPPTPAFVDKTINPSPRLDKVGHRTVHVRHDAPRRSSRADFALRRVNRRTTVRSFPPDPQCNPHRFSSFPPPKIFTNALLQNHDITSLIRDTEVHERALFSVPPPAPLPKAQDLGVSLNRRNTTFNVNGSGSTSITGGGANAVRAPRRNTAVAAVLGTELVERIRRGGGGGAGSGLGYRTYDGPNKNEVDVETLLEGAEKLLNV
jgi:hypothetical protein